MPIQYGIAERKMVPHLDGISIIIQFSNGYGADISCFSGSYGGSRGLFELMVLRNDEPCFDTKITGDVEGFLDFGQVEKLLDEISRFPEIPRPHN